MIMLRLAKNCASRLAASNGSADYKLIYSWNRSFSSALHDTEPSEESVKEKRRPQATAVQAAKKPITNTPFVKNLFLGRFDKQMLVFPEALEKDELKNLDEFVEPIKKYFSETDFKKADDTGSLPNDVVQQLKNFGLFGLQIPIDYGGLGQNATKFTRLAEIFGVDESIAITLLTNQTLGVEGLLLAGTDEIKAKYLPKLATGEHLAAFCLSEPNSGSDAAMVETRARLSDDGKAYILNGEKSWVVNGDRADIFTVFAKTRCTSHAGESAERLTAYLVEKSFGGVTCGNPDEKSGFRAANTCSVRFENTPVPVENVLGGVGEGFRVASSILNNSRHVVGSLTVSLMKKMLDAAVNHAIKRKQFDKPLKDFGLIQDKISRTALNIYATESMTYATAALIDSHAHADASLEAAIVKVFGSEALQQAITDCIQVMGYQGLTKEQEFEQHLRSSHAYSLFPGTNEILRLYISLMGIQHAGLELTDMVRKLRDPLNNVGFVLQQKVHRFKTNRSRPSLEMQLYNHVHPDLSASGEALEERVVKFQYTVEKYMSTYGDKIVDEQTALRRFADVAINFFASTACLARATRSKCIGLRNNDHEIVLARIFTADALTRIDQLIQELDSGTFQNGDDTRAKIAEKVIQNRGYAAEHPLTRNW